MVEIVGEVVIKLKYLPEVPLFGDDFQFHGLNANKYGIHVIYKDQNGNTYIIKAKEWGDLDTLQTEYY